MDKSAIKADLVLGGLGTVQEIYDKVCELEDFSDEQQAVLHKDGPPTEIAYRMAWARTYLKKYGAIENIGRGVWALTSKGKELENIDKTAIRSFVQQNSKPAFDLIDGEQLCKILKDLKLGVEPKTIEVVEIKESWFNHL